MQCQTQISPLIESYGYFLPEVSSLVVMKYHRSICWCPGSTRIASSPTATTGSTKPTSTVCGRTATTDSATRPDLSRYCNLLTNQRSSLIVIVAWHNSIITHSNHDFCEDLKQQLVSKGIELYFLIIRCRCVRLSTQSVVRIVFLQRTTFCCCSTLRVTSGLTRCAGTSSRGSAGSPANATTANSTSCITQVGTCQVNFQLSYSHPPPHHLSLSIRSARMIFHLCIFVRTTSRKMNGFALVLPFSGKSHLTWWSIVPTFIVYNLVSWGNVVRQTPSLFRPFPTILGVAKMEAFL